MKGSRLVSQLSISQVIRLIHEIQGWIRLRWWQVCLFGAGCHREITGSFVLIWSFRRHSCRLGWFSCVYGQAYSGLMRIGLVLANLRVARFIALKCIGWRVMHVDQVRYIIWSRHRMWSSQDRWNIEDLLHWLHWNVPLLKHVKCLPFYQHRCKAEEEDELRSRLQAEPSRFHGCSQAISFSDTNWTNDQCVSRCNLFIVTFKPDERTAKHTKVKHVNSLTWAGRRGFHTNIKVQRIRLSLSIYKWTMDTWGHCITAAYWVCKIVCSSFLLLVARPGAPSSVLAPSSDACCISCIWRFSGQKGCPACLQLFGSPSKLWGERLVTMFDWGGSAARVRCVVLMLQ